MSASTSDKITDIRNSARPVTATVNGTRSSGGTTLLCDSLVGWPTASKVHFVTFQIDSNSNPVAGTQLDCSGIVSGSAINSLTVIDGNDTGNSVSDKVEMLPTAAWGQDLADALTSTHNRSGGLKSGLTITTPTLVTPTLTNPTSTNPTLNSPTFGGTATGTLTSAVLSTPYKFSVYLNGAQTPASSTKILLDTKTFDTGSNFDIVTNHRFVAPITGFYYFEGAVSQLLGNATQSQSAIYKNGAIALTGTGPIFNNSGGNQTLTTNVGGFLSLAASDYIELFTGSSSSGVATNTPTATYLHGFLLAPT